MSRSLGVALLILFGINGLADQIALLPNQWGSFRKTASAPTQVDNPGVFREFGFVSSETADYRGPSANAKVTVYMLQDTTGAFAAWDWLRPADSRHCEMADFCAESKNQVLVFEANYVLSFQRIVPKKAELDALLAGLPGKRSTALPPVTNFIPVKDAIPNSSRYILGPESLATAAPELSGVKPGFEEGAEASYAAYRVDGGVAKLVLFDYPSPEMARLNTVKFKLLPGASVKRSGVLVAIVLPGATDKQADAVLSRVQYQAKILWNEPPPPSPMPALYRLIRDVVMASGLIMALSLAAGVMYGGMRLYRRRYGTLEDEEAMTTLHLTGGQ
jgi:hypothetical protein